jgi:hypothetical protein
LPGLSPSGFFFSSFCSLKMFSHEAGAHAGEALEDIEPKRRAKTQQKDGEEHPADGRPYPRCFKSMISQS